MLIIRCGSEGPRVRGKDEYDHSPLDVPHDGLEFLVGEQVLGQPHFELLLQFAHPHKREAFITEPDYFLFQQLEE